MKKLWSWILVAVLCVGLGFAIAKLIQSEPTGIVKEISFTVVVLVPGDFEADMTPKNALGEVEVVVRKGEPAVFQITNTVSGGFDVRIEYLVHGLPEGTYSFSMNPVNPDQATTLTVETAGLQSNTAYVCTLTAQDYIRP